MDTVIIGMAAQRAIDNAVYSDSMVEAAIETCSLEHQTTEHPITLMMQPVLDFTDSGLVPCSVPQTHAKGAPSTKIEIENCCSSSGMDFSMRALSKVPLRYRPILSSASSCDHLGECAYQAS